MERLFPRTQRCFSRETGRNTAFDHDSITGLNAPGRAAVSINVENHRRESRRRRQSSRRRKRCAAVRAVRPVRLHGAAALRAGMRSEEHTSELQSLRHLVCRLLLEKKKKNNTTRIVGGIPQRAAADSVNQYSE